MKFTSTHLIGLIAQDHPASIPVFDQFGVNYYSEGDRTLWAACSAAGVPIDAVLEALESIPESCEEPKAVKPAYCDQATSEITDHIVKVHHEYTRAQMRHIEKLADAGALRGIPSQRRAEELLRKLSEDFRRHMLWEEDIVFPHLIQADRTLRNGGDVPKPFRVKYYKENPLRKLLEEHKMMGCEFKELSELAAVLPEADPFRAALRDLSADDRKHLHLENQVLLNRAVKQGLMT